MYGASFIAGIIYIIALIISLVKIKKLEESYNHKIVLLIVSIIILTIPALLFSISYNNELNAINNSNIVFIYHDREEDIRFGSRKKLGFAIGNDYFKEISLGVSNLKSTSSEFLPDNSKELSPRIYYIKPNVNTQYKDLSSYERSMVLENYTVVTVVSYDESDNFDWEDRSDLEGIIEDIKGKLDSKDEFKITHFEGSDYYILEMENKDSKMLYVYKGKDFIFEKKNDLFGSGSFDYVFLTKD